MPCRACAARMNGARMASPAQSAQRALLQRLRHAPERSSAPAPCSRGTAIGFCLGLAAMRQGRRHRRDESRVHAPCQRGVPCGRAGAACSAGGVAARLGRQRAAGACYRFRLEPGAAPPAVSPSQQRYRDHMAKVNLATSDRRLRAAAGLAISEFRPAPIPQFPARSGKRLRLRSVHALAASMPIRQSRGSLPCGFAAACSRLRH